MKSKSFARRHPLSWTLQDELKLRRNYDGLVNDTVEFALANLHPIKPLLATGPERRWQPTAARFEVLLPEGMPDVMSSPKVLCETYEALTAPHHRDLAIVLQLVLPDSAPLYKDWELARRAHHARISREQFEPCLRWKSAMVRKSGRIAFRGALTCVRYSMGRDETAGRLAIDP